LRIAVIGSGIAGLASAHFLQRRHEVTLFEQDSRAGGHTNTVRAGGHAVEANGFAKSRALAPPRPSLSV
jgi:predicted NAD/FAD-binding protein